jgi:hypothetical protein
MESATGRRRSSVLFLFLAGLQAGLVASLSLLAWTGAAAVLERRSFWTAENLMASVFYGGPAIRRGFGMSTISGLALYVALYSLLGAGFAIAARDRMPRLRLTLTGILFGIGWYYLSFHAIWKAAAPLVTLLHVETTALWGHLLYGALLGRYPVYVARMAEAAAEPVKAPEPAEPAERERQPAEPRS